MSITFVLKSHQFISLIVFYLLKSSWNLLNWETLSIEACQFCLPIYRKIYANIQRKRSIIVSFWTNYLTVIITASFHHIHKSMLFLTTLKSRKARFIAVPQHIELKHRDATSEFPLSSQTTTRRTKTLSGRASREIYKRQRTGAQNKSANKASHLMHRRRWSTAARQCPEVHQGHMERGKRMTHMSGLAWSSHAASEAASCWQTSTAPSRRSGVRHPPPLRMCTMPDAPHD